MIITILSGISSVASAVATIVTYINGRRMANGNVSFKSER